MTVSESQDERVWALCITCGGGGRGFRGGNNTSRAVWAHRGCGRGGR